MLSVTYTISDVKSKLKNDYLFYGYTSATAFSDDIEEVAEDVMRIYFYQRIGKVEYDRIATLDRTGLTLNEEYIYWAEVYTICVEFLRFKGAQRSQLENSSNERLTVEGYTYQNGSSSSANLSQGDLSLKYYRDKMLGYWKLSGFNILGLERTCTIFGGTEDTLFGATIIE